MIEQSVASVEYTFKKSSAQKRCFSCALNCTIYSISAESGEATTGETPNKLQKSRSDTLRMAITLSLLCITDASASKASGVSVTMMFCVG